MSFWKKLFGIKETPKRPTQAPANSDPHAPSIYELAEEEFKPQIKDNPDLAFREDTNGDTPLNEMANDGQTEVADLPQHHASADTSSNSQENFERWKSSAGPKGWAREHLHGWNHGDWLDFLASLRKSQYWPMDEDAIGHHMEMLRAKLTTVENDESA